MVMTTRMLQPEATEATDKSVRIMSAGPRSAVALKGDRLYWVCDLGGGNVFHRVAILPHGVGANDVVSLSCSPDGASITTRSGNAHFWSAQAETWTAALNLFRPPTGSR